jgi:hypothetical protein
MTKNNGAYNKGVDGTMSDSPVDSQEQIEDQGQLADQERLADQGQRMCAALRQITDYLRGMENERNEQTVEEIVLEGEVLIMQFEEEHRAIGRRLRALTAGHRDEDLPL